MLGLIPLTLFATSGMAAASLAYKETSNILIAIIAFIFNIVYLIYFGIRYGLVQKDRLYID